MLGNGTVRINLLNYGARTSSKAGNKNIPRCRIHRLTKLQQSPAPPEDTLAPPSATTGRNAERGKKKNDGRERKRAGEREEKVFTAVVRQRFL